MLRVEKLGGGFSAKAKGENGGAMPSGCDLGLFAWFPLTDCHVTPRATNRCVAHQPDTEGERRTLLLLPMMPVRKRGWSAWAPDMS